MSSVKVTKNTSVVKNKNNTSIKTKNKLGNMSIDNKGNVDLSIKTPDGKRYKKKKNIFDIVKRMFKH